MKKRIACLLLALVMLVGLIPATAIPAKAAGFGYSDAGLRVIKQHEGFHKNAFKSGDRYFIGYGTPSVEGATTTEANADKLLREVLDEITKGLNTAFAGVELVQKRMDALVWYSYTEYRSAAWAVAGHKLYDAVKSNAGASAIVDAMCTSTFDGISGGDTTRAFILNRRLCMANLYLNGSYNANDAGGCTYALFEGGSGSSFPDYKIQGFYASGTTRITVAPPTLGDQIFLGWYLDGSAVTALSSAAAGRILSARWQQSTHPVGSNYQISADVIYEAHVKAGGAGEDQLYIYSVPGGEKIDVLNRQIVLTVVNELMAGGGKWLHLSTGGWVLLGALDKIPESVATKVVTVTDDYVNIRQQPDAKSTKVGAAKRGEQLFITRYSDDTKWGYCSQGWVFLAYTDYAGNSSPATSNGAAPSVTSTPGTVTGATRVNVRSGPGVGNALVTTVAEGTAVNVYEQTTADGAPWGRIDQGWISLGYVKLQQVQKPTDGSTIGAGSTAIVSSSVRLNVRSGPGTTYNKVATLAPGTSVVILRKETRNGVTWGLIDQGWINMSYVTTSGLSSSSEGGSVYSVGGTVVNCSTGVNIRAAAGPTNALIGVAGVGTRVNVTEITEVNGFKWGHIERGWVCMDYVQLDSEFKKPEPTVPNVEVEDEPDNVVSSFEGYPAKVKADKTTGIKLRDTAAYHANTLLMLKAGADINILAWSQNGDDLYGKVTVGDKTGWVDLSEVEISTFNAKVTASKADVYENPSTRSKCYTSLLYSTYVSVATSTDNSNWKLSDGILWGKISHTVGAGTAAVTYTGWIKMSDVTMFRSNTMPTGKTTYNGAGYLLGTLNAECQLIKDTNGNVTFKTDGTPDYVQYTLPVGSRVNILARNYQTDGKIYGKVKVGSVTGWIDISNSTVITLDPVTMQANAEVKCFSSKDVVVAGTPTKTIPAGSRVTITERALVPTSSEINHGIIDAGKGYIGDNMADVAWFILDDGKLVPTTAATVEDPNNPLIASSVVVSGKANGEVTIREEAIDDSTSLLKVANGTVITVLNWKNVDSTTWCKVQLNKIVGWVKSTEIDFTGLTGTVNVEELMVYTIKDKSSPVQVLRINNKEIDISNLTLVDSILWGYINVAGYPGWIDLSQVKLSTGGFTGESGTAYMPAIAKGKVNALQVLTSVDGTNVRNIPKGTEVSLIDLKIDGGKAKWLVELGEEDSWIDMDYVDLYSAIATVTASSLEVYEDTSCSKTLYTLYTGEKATVQRFYVAAVGAKNVLLGEVPYNNTTGWIKLYDSTDVYSGNTGKAVTLVPGSTGSSIGGGTGSTGSTTPTTPTTPAAEPIAAYIVCNTNVNVRSGAGVDNALATTLPNGTNVKIYEKTVVLGKEWARIDQGWVCMDYVRIGTLANVPNGGNNGNSGSVAIITTVPAGAIAVGYANQDISIRSGSNNGYPEVGTVKKGNSVAIYENKLEGGMSWGRTDNGWICTSYLTITGIGVSGSGSMGTIARCGFTANVRYSANSNAPLMAKVMISSRVAVHETTTVGTESWARTDLGWINTQYVVMDTETAPAPTTPDATTPTETTPVGTVDDSVG